MSYRHGVYVDEVPTSVLAPREISAAIPFVVGTSPTVKADGSRGPINEVKLCHTYSEAVAYFGESVDFANYTLNEFLWVFFRLYNVAPVLAVNVLDPDTHNASVAEAEALTFDSDDEIQVANAPVAGDVVVTDSTDVTTYVEDTDYEVNYLTGKISRIADGSIAEGETVHVTYDYADPSAVASSDIIGGVDGETGVMTGLELVDRVFPQFGLVVGTIAAPGWSQDSAVAAIMAAKAELANEHFRAIAVVDLPTSVETYSDCVASKTTLNLFDERQVVCWPKVKLGDYTFWLSSHVAAMLANVDADWDDIPFKSPSNEPLKMDTALAGDTEVWLGPNQASYLNGQGIVTALNFYGGWKLWGNRTACYPAVTDPKDSFIPVKRMFNWIANTLILTAWQRVDFPIRRRLVDTILDTFNLWLNGLTAGEFILGGRVEFLESENPTSDVMDGIIRFHVYVTPPSPAREINFTLEYDPEYISSIFG